MIDPKGRSALRTSLLVACIVQLSGFPYTSATSPAGQETIRTLPRQRDLDLPLLFEENQGQTIPEAKFLTPGRNFILLLTPIPVDKITPPGKTIVVDAGCRMPGWSRHRYPANRNSKIANRKSQMPDLSRRSSKSEGGPVAV